MVNEDYKKAFEESSLGTKCEIKFDYKGFKDE